MTRHWEVVVFMPDKTAWPQVMTVQLCYTRLGARWVAWRCQRHNGYPHRVRYA